MHIGMAASVWGSAPVASHAGAVQSLDASAAFPGSALGSEGATRMACMMAGIRKYHHHPYQRALSPLPVVWQKGTVRLFECRGPDQSSASPLLIVPSMINGSSILDLLPERSFVRWLSGHGRTVYLLDWGQIAEDEGMPDLSAVLENRLGPAGRFLAAQHEGGVHLLGYCMGGLLALMLAAGNPALCRSLLLLATPWDFHAGSMALINRVRFWSPSVLSTMETMGVLPAESIQALFASVDPMLAARKFSRFAGMDDSSLEAQVFVATEDWLDSGVDLPRGIARTCIQDWYLENATGRGEFALIPAESIRIPALILAARRDRLVPFESAAALAGVVLGARLLGPECGHIGMMAGRRAVDQVWRPCRDWLGEQDSRCAAG